MKKNETVTLSHLATTLVDAAREGLIRMSMLEQLRSDLLDAHMSVSIEAEETVSRVTERRGELLGSFGDQIEDALDRNAAAIARDNDLCPDCGHDMDDHDMRDSPPTCPNRS